MKKNFFSALLLATATLHAELSMAEGLALSGTRLIYDATKKEASITVNNTGKNVPHLVQSWVSDINLKTENIPFITTPPLSKLGPNSTVPVRVVNVMTGNQLLPADRESLYLLHVRAVPATEKSDNPQRMTVAIQNTIKLLYRPAGLSSKEAMSAAEKLTVSALARGVKFENPTPYAVTLTNMTINGANVERPGVVMPFASLTVPFSTATPQRVTFSSINDFGGVTPARNLTL